MLSRSLAVVLAACFTLPTIASRIDSYPKPYQLPGVAGNSFGKPGVNATYDYVVVGGGTAGLAIAARLAQNFSVAVVEAGSFYEVENGNGTTTPGLYGQQDVSPAAPLAPLIDWNFQTLPIAGAANRSLYYARGKTLGGSSARNFLTYHRPTAGSMQQWADEVGDDSYTWENVMPFFERSVTITLPNTADRFANSSIDFNGTSILAGSREGPVQVTWPNFAPSVYSWFYRAFNAIGIVSDTQAFLGGMLNGISWTASTMDPQTQQRSTSQSGYMYKAMLETDIKVYTRALAKEILFDGNNTATGVRVDTAGREFYLSADKEVIISAGAFQSPQLLMVSGIGPSSTLEKFDIAVRKDLPGVGQNMWDHPIYSTTYAVDVETSFQLRDPKYAAQAARDYIANQTGVLTAPPGMLAWERLTNRTLSDVAISTSTTEAMSGFAADWPEIEYILMDGSIQPPPNDGRNYASIGVALITPLSRGFVTIQSADSSDPPVINPNYLDNQADVELLVNGFKRTRTMWAQLTNITIGAEIFPGPNVTTDAQIEQYIRQNLIPVWHPSVTCKMGRSNDTMAVVDSRCRVFGTQNLRVVDASAFPLLTPGHPQSVAYMLAEKIADDILHGA